MTVSLTRRHLLRGLAGLSAGTALPLRPEDGSGALTFWHPFSGGTGARITRMLDAHRATGVTATSLSWGNPFYSKLRLATLGGRPPDVAVVHLTRVERLVADGLLEELTPGELAHAGITPERLDPAVWAAGLAGGRAYAVPLDTHPFVMFYNADVCGAAGLLDAGGRLAPLDSPERFAGALRRAGGAMPVTGDPCTPWRMFWSWYSQLGGRLLADGGRTVVIDDAPALRVLDFMRSLTADGLLSPELDHRGAAAAFADGRAGFYFQGGWELSTFPAAQVALFPRLFGEGAYRVQADSHLLVIPAAPRRDPERIQRALGLIRSLLEQSRTWAEGGHVPSWLPARDGTGPLTAAVGGAAYDPDGWYSGSGSNLEIVAGSAVAAVLQGRRTPPAALAHLRAGLTSLAGTPA